MGMLADLLLRLLGNNPAAYPTATDKWIKISVIFTFYAVPILLGLLFTSPFIFLWIGKKKFSIRNLLLAMLIGALLLSLGIGLIYLGIMLLHAYTVREIYNFN